MTFSCFSIPWKGMIWGMYLQFAEAYRLLLPVGWLNHQSSES